MCSCGSTCLVSTSPSLIYLVFTKSWRENNQEQVHSTDRVNADMSFCFFHCLAFKNGRFRQRKWVTTAQVVTMYFTGSLDLGAGTVLASPITGTLTYTQNLKCVPHCTYSAHIFFKLHVPQTCFYSESSIFNSSTHALIMHGGNSFSL